MNKVRHNELMHLIDSLHELQNFIFSKEVNRVTFYSINLDRMVQNTEFFLRMKEENVVLLYEILKRDWKNVNNQMLGISECEFLKKNYDGKEEDVSTLLQLLADIEECLQVV